MRKLIIFLVVIAGIGIWWLQAGVALRKCYLDHVEEQTVSENKYTGVLTSGLATEKQKELNDVVIDSYPECDKQISAQFFMPEFGMNILAQAAQK